MLDFQNDFANIHYSKYHISMVVFQSLLQLRTYICLFSMLTADKKYQHLAISSVAQFQGQYEIQFIMSHKKHIYTYLNIKIQYMIFWHDRCVRVNQAKMNCINCVSSLTMIKFNAQHLMQHFKYTTIYNTVASYEWHGINELQIMN